MKLETDALFNTDRSNTFISFPASLNDAFLIQVPHKAIARGTVINIATTGRTTVYVAFELGRGRTGGFERSLPNAGWTKEEDNLQISVLDEFDIYSFVVNGASSVHLPATTTERTVISILSKC